MQVTEDKLFWKDPYNYSFKSVVSDVVQSSKTGVILEGTYFFPEGGGQPADKGRIENHNVVDVQEVNGRIVHFLDGSHKEIDKGFQVNCEISKDYRVQNMRAHTAAHLLFGAARKLFDTLKYAGFDIHGGGGSLYLETDTSITNELMVKMLDFANNVVVDNLPIKTYFVDTKDVFKIPGVVYNVKLPDEKVRIVEIEGWDIAVCSGTHLAHTVEVGPISIVGREKHKKATTRIDYVVGKVAVQHITQGERQLGKLSSLTGTNADQLFTKVETIQNELNEERKSKQILEKSLAELQIKGTLDNLDQDSRKSTLVLFLRGVSKKVLSQIASETSQANPSILVGLVGQEDDVFAVLARGSNNQIDLDSFSHQLISSLDGRGGGSKNFVSIGGINAAPLEVVSKIQEFIEGVSK